MTKSYAGVLDWIVKRPIAHRGLHDGNVGICENSIPAALAAIEAGYAIECDVLLSSDGVPFVFHDAMLERLTGASGAFHEKSAEELSSLRLGTSDAVIPTVRDFLETIGGRVPVIMELKGTSAAFDARFIERLRPVLDVYDGPLALMSFDPWLIHQALALERFPVGLTAEGTAPGELAAHRAIYERGCAFTSYNVHHLPNDFVRWVRDERQAPVITWTVRNADEEASSAVEAHQITFEGFRPST